MRGAQADRYEEVVDGLRQQATIGNLSGTGFFGENEFAVEFISGLRSQVQSWESIAQSVNATLSA